MLKLENFDALRLTLASPATINSWSHGEVTKPETINYRTLRPERDGLFCERIFGPTRDWECHCGKYKRYRYKGIICDKCGVEVTRSKVRRERMGHIKLASPVSHVWYFKGIPSRMGLLLDMSPRNLEKVLYFANYIVTDVDEDSRTELLSTLTMENDDRPRALREEIEAKADQLRSQHEGRHNELKSEVDAELARLEREHDETVQLLTEQGQSIQEAIQNGVGTKSKRNLVIGPDDDEEVVVPRGDVLSEDMTAGVLRKVQERIERAEANTRAGQEDVRERLRKSEAQLEETIQAATGEERERIQAELEGLDEQITSAREALEGLHVKQLLTDTQYREYEERFGRVFRAGIGAEAIKELLSRVDLDQEYYRLREESKATSGQRKQKAIKRLKVVEDFRKSESSPTWMVLETLPVIPPELRPMVQLDGGRFATSDLNDLYRRVINRNNRLKRLLELGAPEIIVRNEKRMLQEAVDALIDNGRRGRAITGTGNRKLKSLSDLLKGKQGRFRQNLLGKRVDYSGRSVIVVGPDLKLNECGLPKKMAIELFKPFVMRELVNKGYTTNIKTAKRMVERMRDEVWDVLDEVIHEHPVLLNRAPTLHRLGIQAFNPVLVEGSAIQIHPLVCAAFNADFDGDQMAVHVPLFSGAIAEAKNLMMSSQNILSAADGNPVVAPTQDIVLGCYWLTAVRGDEPSGEAVSRLRAFSSPEEAVLAYQVGKVGLQEWVRARVDGELRVTTPGRVIFNQVLPLGLEPLPVDDGTAPTPLRYQNLHFDRKQLRKLVGTLYRLYGNEVTAGTVNEIKRLGFHYATQSGITVSAMMIPHAKAKPEILDQTEKEVDDVERMYRRGVMTEEERYRKVIELWTSAQEDVARATEGSFDPFDPIWIMMTSGARGNIQQVRQLAGMRGLMADPTGRIIDLPIKANFAEGLTVLEYFISTHGARKGLADTALRTADSGYLTRRLVDVAQDVIVRAEDCDTRNGIWEHGITAAHAKNDPVLDVIEGRVAAEDIVTKDGEILARAGDTITEHIGQAAIEANVGSVKVRSVLTCEAREGVCRLCYGRNLATGKLVEIGEAVGVIAAQSIGEPGTQLTMRTFHTGGVAGLDITQGLPRVEELFEARIPKGKAIISEIDGELEIIRDESGRKARIVSHEEFEVSYPLEAGMEVLVSTGDQVMEGQELARQSNGEAVVRTRHAGVVTVSKKEIAVRAMDEEVREYVIPHGVRIRPELEPREGASAHVEAGEQITEGAVNPQDLLQIRGKEAVQTFLVAEVQKVYRSQGVDINNKHIEVIVRQMMRKVRIDSAGDTSLLPGEIVTQWEYEEANREILAEGGEPATAHTVLLGLIKAALNTTSWLSAASFQETTRVLTEAAISGKVDRLRGLKENVIIGKLIPAGTGLDYYKKHREQAARATEEEEQIDLDTLSV